MTCNEPGCHKHIPDGSGPYARCAFHAERYARELAWRRLDNLRPPSVWELAAAILRLLAGRPAFR